MKQLKISKLALALSCALLLGGQAQAQWVVIDPAAIAKQVLQLEEMYKQYQKMQEQLQQLKKTYDSMNGMRDTSSLLKNDLLKQAVPLDFQKFQDAVKASAQGGSGSGISGDINKYVSANQSVTCDKAYTSAAQQKTCKQNWSEIGGQQVVGQTGYDAAFKDLDNIGAMLNAIKATPDAKAIADMQARLQLQAVKQAGEAAKLNAYKLMTDANDRMKIQKASDDYSASAKRVLN